MDVSRTIHETVHTNANAGTNVRFTGEASHFDRQWARCGRRSCSSICTSVPFELLDIYEAQVVNRFFQLIVFSTTSFPLFFEVRQFGLPGGLVDGGKSAPNGAKLQKELLREAQTLHVPTSLTTAKNPMDPVRRAGSRTPTLQHLFGIIRTRTSP